MKKIVFLFIFLYSIVFAQNTNPHVILKTTKGDIELELYPNVAPLAVENFLTHVKDGYYNHIIFHRVIKNFMIQSGDPSGTGRGGQSIWKKPFKDEFKGKLFDKSGVLAMANRGRNTNGSQFFITVAPAFWLNGYYTIFGQATKKSLMVIKEISEVATTGKSKGNKPLKKIEIIKAYIKQN